MLAKTTASLLLFLLSCSALLAQNAAQNIRGTVADATTKRPLAGCVVTTGGTPALAAVTDSAGAFLFAAAPQGRYDICVAREGYEPLTLREILHTAAKETMLEISLRESNVALKTVVVRPRANKISALNDMVTTSGRLLGVEEASRFAGGLDDPARLAGAFAGAATNIGDNGITIRGNAPKALQWRLEGVEIPNPNHFGEVGGFGGGGLTALSSHVLGNSDFLTGAFPAEYGNALSGVFDIRLRTGNNARRESAVALGTMGIDLASEGPLARNARASYLFNYRYSTLSLISPFLPDGAGAGMKYQDVSFKVCIPTPRTGTFSLWGLGLIDANRERAERNPTKWEFASDREVFTTHIATGAIGLTHIAGLGGAGFMKTTLAATGSAINSRQQRPDDALLLRPDNDIRKNTTNLVLTSQVSSKIARGVTNKTGVTATGMFYNVRLRSAPHHSESLARVADEHGASALLEAFTHFAVQGGRRWLVSPGIRLQHLTLNGRSAVEPRLGVRYTLSPRTTIGLAYGMHSRMEPLNCYLTRGTDGRALNRGLDFTRAHHVVASCDVGIGSDVHLRIEPYVQMLYRVPVVRDSSLSLVNLKDEWFMTDKFESTGRGMNYGVELTAEKFMTRGYYWLVTASLFSSRYRGGDGLWRSTRHDRTFLLNALGGREWGIGRRRQNLLGVNVRVTLRGGDRYTPVLHEASQAAGEAVFDERRALSRQLPPVVWGDFTVSYRMNRCRASHEIALKMLNATMHQEYLGHEYNLRKRRVVPYRDGISMPNLYYKIFF